MKRHYQELSHYGPGGRNCTCCGPAPRERKAFDRTVKRRERRLMKMQIKFETLNNEE